MMIKPSSLWALFKSCKDSKWLGDICRALGQQDVELDFGQQQTLAMIEQDNEWMDERLEDQRKRCAERKRKSRLSRDVTNVTVTNVTDESHSDKCDSGQDSDVTKVTVTDACHIPSIPPSIPPSVPPSNSVCVKEHTHTHTRVGMPSEDEVVSVATSVMGVPEAYARWWWSEMVARDWVKTDGSRVTANNWRPLLKAWWNRSDEKERTLIANEAEAKKAKAGKVYGREQWVLCEERCANFDRERGCCSLGARVPPQYAGDGHGSGYPPEECARFKALSGEG